MGFGLPLALLGALAIAAPIVVHLLRQRDVPTFRLPTVSLLSRATAESRRRLRLRDLWLLLLRALAILAFALGAAQPWVATSRAFDDGRRASLAIVLDDSMSMTRREEGVPLLQTAVTRALEQLAALPPESEASLVLAGAPARLAVPRTRELDVVRRALLALPEQSARGTALPEALEVARTSLSGAAHLRRVFVVSDFAAHAQLAELPPTRGVEWALDPLGRTAPRNAAIVEAHSAPDPTTPGQLSVEVLLRAPVGRHEVEVLHDGVRLGVADVNVVSSGEEALVHPARVTLHVAEPAVPDATVRLVVDDALPADDARGLLLSPAAAVRALLVNGEPHASRDRDEVGYLTRALEAAPRDDGGVAFHVVDVEALAQTSLDDVDVVVLANVATLRAPARARLRRFVDQGGGLLAALGERVDARSLRTELAWLPATVQDPRALPEGTSLRTTGPGLPALDADVRRIMSVEPALGADVLVVTKGADESAPVLVRASQGDGSVALLAVPLDDAWSELPFDPGYVPFVARLLRDLAVGRGAPSAVLTAGATIDLPPRAVVLDPTGTRHEPIDGAFSSTHLAGVYRVMEEDVVQSSFVIAPPAGESDLTPGELPAAQGSTDRARRSGETRRRPVDRWLFLLGGLALLGEGWLRVRRPR